MFVSWWVRKNQGKNPCQKIYPNEHAQIPRAQPEKHLRLFFFVVFSDFFLSTNGDFSCPYFRFLAISHFLIEPVTSRLLNTPFLILYIGLAPLFPSHNFCCCSFWACWCLLHVCCLWPCYGHLVHRNAFLSLHVLTASKRHEHFDRSLRREHKLETQVGLEPYMHGKMRPIRKGVGLVIAGVSKRSKPISKSHHCCDSLLDDWPGKTTLAASLDKTKQRPSSKRVAKKSKKQSSKHRPKRNLRQAEERK